jgi:radical SAM superfamily enzyme YgiQ (UPF0313 family)
MAFDFKSLTHKAEPREIPSDIEDRHQAMLLAIAPYAKPNVQKNVTTVDIKYSYRDTKLVLVLLPEWAAQFPPFNLARLSAVAKQAGYETTILDINARCYKEYKEKIKSQNTLNFTLWNPASSWRWVGENYYTFIHEIFKEIFYQYIEKIKQLNPTVVGFSVYQFSEEPTKWFIQELKKELPDLKIIVGGSNVQHGWFQIQPYYDYVVNGEGEQNILKILEEIENKITHTQSQFLSQPEDQRININDLPMPDYDSINFNDYEIPNGALSELSRGCTAKCTFCEETHFWKYRQRRAVDALKEIEYLYYNKGTDIIWFIDSLVNGNLKELRAFAKGVVAKGLKIKWTGYARCDGRMDYEYLKDLADSGCIALNYGCESGSQRVLNDIDKGVTVAEMEQNFIDGKKVGIHAATNWIVGFPTETCQDFTDTMTFLWRMRNENINNIGTGMGFGLGQETIVGQNPDKFNLSYHKYLGYWITKDFKLGGSHVLTRVKSFNILIDNLVSVNKIAYPKRPDLQKFHYNLKFDDENIRNEICYENFDYNIIKSNINPYADSLVNEIWPILRMLWRARGGYQIKIVFDPKIDTAEFGGHFGTGKYYAIYDFEINRKGEWKADFDIKFEQYWEYDQYKEIERQGPFFAQEYSRMMGNAAVRARQLADPIWGSQGRNNEEFQNLLDEETFLNQSTDFSFEFSYKDQGSWENFEQFQVEIPKHHNSINYKPIQFYKASLL